MLHNTVFLCCFAISIVVVKIKDLISLLSDNLEHPLNKTNYVGGASLM